MQQLWYYAMITISHILESDSFSVCPENQIFSECTGCRLRCVDQFDPPLCSGGCSPGCTCPPGMLLDGDVCVSLEDCPAIGDRL